MFKARTLKILIVTMVLSLFANPIFAINIYYQNYPVSTDSPPIVKDGRTLVPISAIATRMGTEVSWNGKAKAVTIKKYDLELVLTIGSKNISVIRNGFKSTVQLDVPAMTIEGRTMVPIGAIAQIFGSNVAWDAKSNSVLIDSDDPNNFDISNYILEPIVEKAVASYVKQKDTFFTSPDYRVFVYNYTFTKDEFHLIDLLMLEQPGNYRMFSVYYPNKDYIGEDFIDEDFIDEDFIEPFDGFIDINTHAVYISDYDVVFSANDYKVYVNPMDQGYYFDVPPELDWNEQYKIHSYETFATALARADRKIPNSDLIKSSATLSKDRKALSIGIYKLNNLKEVLITTYLVDLNENTVTDLSNNKVVYSGPKG